MDSSAPTLGVLLRKLRSRHGWTLKQMSENSGIPLSTLSKVEHDRLTLTYDKLYQVSQRLGIPISELFAETGQEAAPATVTARRSIGDIDQSLHVETPNYDYYFLCTELRRKRMIPVITKIRAKTSEEFGELVHHPGEEFIYVLRGTVVVNTEFYDPVVLAAGQSIYIDSSMGHAYLAADSCDEAEVLGVMSSGGEDLQESLLSIHDAHGGQQRDGAAPRRSVRQ
jgi:transcriptional regulator with XRE-family HTH domain